MNPLQTRVEMYVRAAQIAPDARADERQIMLDLLRVKPDDRICDVPAWGGYLAAGLAPMVSDPKQITCVEPAPAFLQLIPDKFDRVRANLEKVLPLRPRTFDAVGSLVGLHHIQDKLAFVWELARITKPGGRIALSEVVAGSRPAQFLNDAVNRLSPVGHRGEFVSETGLGKLMEAAGLVVAYEHVHHDLVWRFTSFEQTVGFCQHLFGMSRATPSEMTCAIIDNLEIAGTTSGEIELKWPLVYALGIKR